MCGIAGEFWFSNNGAPDKARLKRMNDAIANRGPDGEGTFIDKKCGLAHRRLSIIDLTSRAKQPMTNEDGSIHIIFNGEIYNFQELRPELERLGHRFSSNTDTEVILHAYESWGPECVKRLRGMFAFAIWDTTKRRLMLARDRVGKKPLCYAKEKDRIIFASELKAILTDESLSLTIDPQAVSDYLSYGYIPAPATIFKEIRKLPPAHYLLIDERGRSTTHQYWDLHFSPQQRTMNEWIELLQSEMRESVRLRLMSEVPLGVFLSGGIDSSSVVALASGLVDKPLKTFSIGFKEEEYNELSAARIVAEKFSTDHHEFVVQADAVEVVPELARLYNEPYADSSALPSYYLARMTRKHVTVALNGDGGDENFAGYYRYALAKGTRIYQSMNTLSGVAGRLISMLPSQPNYNNPLNKMQRFVRRADLPLDKAYAHLMQGVTPELKETLWCGPHTESADRIVMQNYHACTDKSFIHRAMYSDIKHYLPDDLLVKMDIACMSQGVEGRSPLLDHHLMELAATIPSSLKLHGWTKKYILKRAMAPLLPRTILRKRKQGFGIPINEWLRGQLNNLAHDTLLENGALLHRFVKKDEIRHILEQHKTTKHNHGGALWTLMMFTLWHRAYRDRLAGI